MTRADTSNPPRTTRTARTPRRLAALALVLALGLLAGCEEGRDDARGAMQAREAEAASGRAAAPEAAPQAAPTRAVQRTPVEMREVRPRDFSLSSTYIGHLLPEERVALRAEREGVAERVTVEEGDAVMRGQVLANISTEQLKVRRDLARSDLELARSNYQRSRTLAEKELLPTAQLDEARNRRDAARYNLRLAELELDKSQVRAPLEGKVKTLAVEPGEFVNKGQLLLELLDISTLRARVDVPEREIRHVRPGKPVQVTVEALPGERFPGVVAKVGLEADTRTRTFPVEVGLDNPGERLRPGMLARVQVQLARYERQVLVPRHAVLERERGRVVFVAENGRAVERPVETGAASGSAVQVLSGLRFGEQVIVTGQQKLTDQEPIAVRRVAR